MTALITFTVLYLSFSAVYLVGYQISASRIWKIFIEISKEHPDSKMSEWTEILEENKPTLFGLKNKKNKTQ